MTPEVKCELTTINWQEIKTYPLSERRSKVSFDDFARPGHKGISFAAFWGNLPNILAAADFKAVVEAIVNAYKTQKSVLLGMGAHVIKCGLGPLVNELVRRGVLKGIAMNGACIIHDFEIAYAGKTSEDVERELHCGRFGMVQETGEFLNQTIKEGVAQGLGIGRAVGKKLLAMQPPFKEYSILYQCALLEVPVTVHVAVGTDIIHMHPAADGAAIGGGSLRDFREFTSLVAGLSNGGVYINLGSAVILPEVFLKAVSVLNNLGHGLKNFTTVNMDFVQHYRPRENVLKRPVAAGGKGYALTGHHEIMLPLLTQSVIELLEMEEANK
ncbi:MAG: hypothetical protein M1489_06710 [Firmicutes bacterium]|nr:hypothetical protein [Bacillota bacterium]